MRSLTLVAAALAFVPVATTVDARPDFSRSRMTISPPIVAEGDLVTLTTQVTNSGDEDAPFTEITLELPLEAMFVDSDGIDARVDVHEKVLGATVAVPAGATRTFRVRLIVPRDAGGRVLMPDLTARYLHAGVEFRAHERFDIDTRVAPAAFRVAGVGVTGAGLAVAVIVLAFPLLWFAIRATMTGARGLRDESGRRLRTGGARHAAAAATAFAIVLPVGFWAMFAGMAVRDWKAMTAWQGTTCEIADSRIREEANAPEPSPFRRTRTTSSRVFQPLLALRYPVDGREVISTGFDTGSHLRIGGWSQAATSIAAWRVGARVPCWYDPSNPADVVVRRGFGGAYLFALFPLPVALFALYRVRALLHSRRSRLGAGQAAGRAVR